MERRTKKEVISGNDKVLQMMKDAKHIWVSTDWHYVKYDKQTKKIYVRDEFNDIMKACSVIQPDDLWIYLGDIIDSEIQTTSHIDMINRYINTKNRVLLLGNNDRFSSYDNWFTVVCNTILMPEERVVITHCPIDNHEKINIHGHIHVGEPGYGSAGKYWEMYDIIPENHVNAFTYPFKPIQLKDIMKKKPKAFVQDAEGLHGKPYTFDLVHNEEYEYRTLCNHYRG